jgi:hypothetical protein
MSIASEDFDIRGRSSRTNSQGIVRTAVTACHITFNLMIIELIFSFEKP